MIGSFLRAKALRDEYDQNEKSSPPSEQQIRWHIQHMREDMMLLCQQYSIANFLLFVIMLAVVVIAFKL
jgi:hypothetical protein